MPGLRRIAYRLYQGFWSSLDWLYPPVCGGCGNRGSRWCPVCEQKASILADNVCPVCGRAQASRNICWQCQKSSPQYTALRSWAEYEGPVQKAIQRLKYKRDMALGELFAAKMIQFFHNLNWEIDLVTPVPLGVARLAQRGYNQAALLAWPLAMKIDRVYAPRALERVRETRSQVDLSAIERKANVSGAFKARREIVNARRILVVDDVATTGSTFEACAAALFDAGASMVYGLTLARTVLKPSRQGFDQNSRLTL